MGKAGGSLDCRDRETTWALLELLLQITPCHFCVCLFL